MQRREETPIVADPPNAELAVWEFAGLLLTYWCNARCAFCYVYSAPEHRGHMRVADAVNIWRSLDQLAAKHGKKMRIHLSGGEPFGDWPHLLSLVRAARDAGLTPLEKIETNAFWAASDGLTRARLEQLDALGMQLLVVSTDVYHQEYVPFDRVKRCVEIAREVLGGGRVRVRWWNFFKQPTDTRKLDQTERLRAYAEALARHKDRLTGRAADRLANLLPRMPAERFRGQSCAKEILHSRHVHIDPYGHVFPGVCNGIILGNALREPLKKGTGPEPPLFRTATVSERLSEGASEAEESRGAGPLFQRAATRSPEELWEYLSVTWRNHPIVSAVVAGSSYELMQRAKEFGYRELEGGYANKCHLCHHVRQFLHRRGVWPEHVGPAECYAGEP